MNGVRLFISSAWLRLLRFFASNHTASVAILGPIPFSLLALALKYGGIWLWLLSPFSYILLIVAATAPQQYARIGLLDVILPTIHKVLKLGQDDRVTIHYLRSRKKEQYEQLTGYHPLQKGGGRVFSLRKGIVGRCFTSRKPLSESLPQNESLTEHFPVAWGYTSDEAAHLRQDRRSYFAFPIGQDREIAKAVLFMDSANSDKFTPANRSRIARRIEDLFLPLLEQVIR